MDYRIILITARSIVIEMKNNDIYYSSEPYEITINNKVVIPSETKNVISIYDLEPNQVYDLVVRSLVTHETNLTQFRTDMEHVRLNIKKFGAKGDGINLDSIAIQAAIMSCPNEGTVLIPEGVYYCTPIFLRSNINIEFEKGAKIIGHMKRDMYPVLPGYTITSDQEDEYYLGTWEGNPLDKFASVITGINVENVNIFGEGIIDGNGSSGDWWEDVRTRRIAWRPRTIFLKGCKNIVFQGLHIQNSPSWTIHPYFSDDLKFIDIKVTNRKDSPNTDGLDPESCNRVDIIGVEFSVGDDCIAIKSGKLYMGKRLKKPSENITIRNCIMKYGHGAVVFGSEMAGGIKNIHVSQCYFKETDRGLRIKTRRGRGKDAIVDGITFENIHMDGVLTPLVINMFYFCDPDGKSEYVWSKDTLPVDEWTPSLGKLSFKNMICDHVEAAAGYFLGLPEQHIKEINMENITFTYKEDASPHIPAMMSFSEPVCKMGIYAENVEQLTLKNVSINGHVGDRIITKNVKTIRDL